MEEVETRSPWKRYLSHCRSMTERDRKNARAANWALLLWAVTMLPAMYLLGRDLVPEGPLVWIAALVPIALSIVAVLAYMHFLRNADELQRKIQLEALALGFGGGFIASFGLELLEEAGLGTYDAGDPLLAMVLLFMVGIFVNTRRYL